jgi:DNA repair protein RecN (Recombination protein N)
MIKSLILNNLVLVESCEIHFGPSFNVITGETGAGKTALIEAIGLALGERADSSLIRKGCDRAYVEVVFDVETSPHLKEQLEEAGIPLLAEEYLVIRREISKEGKNRAFINCRMAPLPLLQKIGAELIDLIGQHAHQTLRSLDAQRSLVDLFSNLTDDLNTFQALYNKEKDLQKTLEELQQLAAHREREQDTYRFQLEEIQSANLKKGEEEATYEQYQKLAHAQELTEKIQSMLQMLSDQPSAVLPQLARIYKMCDTLIKYDPHLKEVVSLINEAQIALTEVMRTLQASENLDAHPQSLQALEDRLSLISRLKRKYGQTFEEIESFRQKIQSELTRLENLSDEIGALKSTLFEAKAQTQQAAEQLSAKRQQAAIQLQQALTAQLQILNMNGAEVTIEVLPQARSLTGDDKVQFWLKANTGELPSLVKEHASGGELSRLLFALKIALAEKNNTPTLMFDEIDANVGGKTASIIGKQLQELGRFRQVICVTHFPQVASQADIHFSVQKVETQGRTVTEIKQLTKKQREQELLRMIGGKELVPSS